MPVMINYFMYNNIELKADNKKTKREESKTNIIFHLKKLSHYFNNRIIYFLKLVELKFLYDTQCPHA